MAQKGHVEQLDGLDQEIADLEAAVSGDKSQQPATDPEAAVVQQPDQAQPQQAPEQEGVQYEEVITNVDEFMKADQAPEGTGQEQAQAPEQQAIDTQPEEVTQQPQSGRRSWKKDYEELHNRYTLLRQSSDTFKFETRQQLAQLQTALANEKEFNEKLRVQLAESQSNAKPQLDVNSYFSEEDRDVLGQDAIGGFQKMMTDAVDQATSPLKMELLEMKKVERERLKTQATGNKNEAYNIFERGLMSLVPDYAAMNTDKEFLTWLNQPSPYSGVPRIKHLQNAETIGDFERVAQFFIEYKQMVQAPEQLLSQNVTPSGQGGGAAPPVGQATPPQGQEKKLFSMAFINQFYDDDIAGAYKGREALRDQLDREIDLAMKEGRVR